MGIATAHDGKLRILGVDFKEVETFNFTDAESVPHLVNNRMFRNVAGPVMRPIIPVAQTATDSSRFPQ